MKYYSDLTKQMYTTEEDLVKAEAAEVQARQEAAAEKKAKEEAAKAKEAKRADRAKEVENAYNDYVTAYKHYQELLNKFLDDYHSYHMTYTNKNVPTTFSDLFDWLFK